MAATSLVNAENSYLGTWAGIYPNSSSDDIAHCALYHLSTTSGNGYNPYGDHIRNCNAGGISSRIVAVEGLNSDGDSGGFSNIAEINANTQPGWTVGDNAPFTGTLEPVANLAPVADAAGPYSGLVGEDVTFDGPGSTDSDGTIARYFWDYGDGFTGTGLMPDHAYASAGGPYAGTIDVPVTFNGSASTDQDGNIVAYFWDFVDGNTGNGATPSHIYTSTGEFTVTLTVSDDAGDTGSDTTTATISDVANEAPAADAGGAYSGVEGEAFGFDVSGSSDVDGSIVYYRWYFGDGSSGTGISPSHTYANAGTYTVTLIVTDDEGARDYDRTTATITVASSSTDDDDRDYDWYRDRD
jgi:PKD repeat protein